MTDDHKVDFDYTLDEAVDYQLQFVRQTREGSSWRKREQWKFGIGITLGLASVLFLTSSGRSAAMFGGLLVASAAIALALVVPFGRVYDHQARTRTKKLLLERFGGGPYHSSIEIRPAGMWVAQHGVELQFPWSEATQIEDTPEGVAVAFRGGRVLARSRGFASPEHRSMFLRKLRELVSAAAAQLPN